MEDEGCKNYINLQYGMVNLNCMNIILLSDLILRHCWSSRTAVYMIGSFYPNFESSNNGDFFSLVETLVEWKSGVKNF